MMKLTARSKSIGKGTNSLIKVLIVSLSLILLNPTSARAAKNLVPNAGKSCPKLGLAIKKDDRLFTCKLKRNKLVWDSGVSLFNSVPKPRTDLNYATLNWNNLESYGFDTIHKIWSEKKQKTYAIKSTINRKLKISPNSGLSAKSQNVILNDADLFFSWIQIPYQYSVFYIDSRDIDWAKAKYLEMYNREINLGSICSTICSGGNAGRVNKDWININIGSATPRKGAPDGFLEFHEYTHVVQQALARGDEEFSQVPGWLIEGHANFFANLGTSKTIEAYSKNRSNYRSGTPEPAPTVESLLQYLNSANSTVRDEKDWRAYNWGFYFVETLSIIFGLDSTISLYREIGAKKTFEEAILSVFGESWDSIKPKLAKAAYFVMQPL